MKQWILITVISLTLLLSSCTSCNPFGKGGDDSSEQTTIIEESSTIQNSQNSGHQQDDSNHHSSRTTDQLGDKKNETSGTLTGKEESSSKPEESSSKPEESSGKPEESSSKPEESSSKPEESSSKPEESSGPTDGQQKALARAKEYLSDGNGWSYIEIINMLDAEGYDHSDSLWAANNCDGNWKEQAAIRAKNYLGLGPMSRSMIIHELRTYDEYSQEESEYGADNCGADWVEQAKLYAKYHMNKDIYSEYTLRVKMDGDGFSVDEINEAIGQFKEDDWNAEAVQRGEKIVAEEFFTGMPWSEMVYRIELYGFTTPQAEYGADNCGVSWNINAANAYINDNTPTSPDELSTYLSGEGYTKSEIMEVLDYFSITCSGTVWYAQAEEYAYYLQGSVMTVKDMVDILKGLGFTEDQAFQGVCKKGGFNEEEQAYYRIYQLINNLDGSDLAAEDKIKSKIVAILVSEGYSATAADSAADSFGLTESVPKG